MIQLKGSVIIKKRKRNSKDGDSVTYKFNDVSQDLALALGLDVLVYPGNNYTGYNLKFGLPSQVVILLKYNEAIVNSLSTTLSSFNDNLTASSETTTAVFNGSDATPKQYTFNRMELWTVVGGVLFLQIAYVDVNEFTKDPDDVIEVTWSESIVTNAPLMDITGYANTVNPSAVQNLQNVLQYFGALQCTNSMFNVIWALLIVPGLCNLSSNTLQCPLSNICPKTPGASVQPPPVAIYALLDSYFNLITTITLPSPDVVIEVGVSGDTVYVVINIIANVTIAPAYILGLAELGTGTYPVFLLPIQGNSVVPGVNEYGIMVTIPFGTPTLQQLQQPGGGGG